ncbi:MAG TPA: ACT domain-containing protein [Solirubrobacterales bacterium]|nr:ACT domain-containing protein [Solirubrobacterales bacterium]
MDESGGQADGRGSSDGFELETLPEHHAVCRLGPGEPIPDWARLSAGALLSITRSPDELSIVCEETLPPPGVERSSGWRALRVSGTLEHTLTGVLLSLAAPLAAAGIPIFAVSTYETDYLLVPGAELERAQRELAAAGHVLKRTG